MNKSKVKHPFAALSDLKKNLEEEEKAKQKELQQGKLKPAQTGKTQVVSPSFGSQSTSLSFADMMRGVKALPETEKGIRIPVSKTPEDMVRTETDYQKENAKHAQEETHATERFQNLVLEEASFEVSDDGHHVEGKRIGINPELLRKLRRGQFPIDGRIDLHGKRSDEAQEMLQDFLKKMKAQGERVILIVHGKGLHSPGGSGLLRGEIAAWLTQTKLKHYVSAFASARVQDGGTGALYVYLQKSI